MKSGTKQVFNEINITPLTDIFLVLLIIMMVVAPMVQQMRQDITPPDLSTGKPVEQNKLTVEVTGDGNVYVQGAATPIEQLTATLKERQEALEANTGGAAQASAAEGAPADAETADAPKDKNLIIRADKATKSGQVLKIFEAARDAGFTKVTVAGEALNEKRQAQLQSGTASSADSPMTDPMTGGMNP